MKKKWLILALLVVVIGIVALPVFAGSFGAGFSTNGVEAEGYATGLRSAKQTGGADITMKISSATGAGIRGILYCGNPGTNNWVAPGVNPIVGDFSGTAMIDSSLIDKNGRGVFDDAHGNAVDAKVTGSTLTALVAYCPNHNWVPLDFVPLEFIATMTASAHNDPTTIFSTTKYRCVLPPSSQAALVFNPSTGETNKQPYACTQIK